MRASVYGQNRTARQVIAALNGWKSNGSAWIRIWRAETGYQVGGEDLPSPPASLALLLAKPMASQVTPQWAKGAKLADLPFIGV